MKYIVLKKTDIDNGMKVLDLVGQCEIGRAPVKVGEHLLIEDLLPLAALGFSITFINSSEEKRTKASPLRSTWK